MLGVLMVRISIVVFLLFLYYFLFHSPDLFKTVCFKMAFSLGGRALSFALRGMGSPGTLALALVGFAVKALLATEAAPYPANMVLPHGDDRASSSESWTRLLGGSSSETETGGTSSNQIAASPAHVNAYPYQPDEVIGGDSVLSIQKRLLDKSSPLPLPHDIDMARIKAEDLFEVKAEIVKLMVVLDPYGDWMGRGARALDNPHTSTGEPSLERLYAILNDLREGGVKSRTYGDFTLKVFRRVEDLDDHSQNGMGVGAKNSSILMSIPPHFHSLKREG